MEALDAQTLDYYNQLLKHIGDAKSNIKEINRRALQAVPIPPRCKGDNPDIKIKGFVYELFLRFKEKVEPGKAKACFDAESKGLMKALYKGVHKNKGVQQKRQKDAKEKCNKLFMEVLFAYREAQVPKALMGLKVTKGYLSREQSLEGMEVSFAQLLDSAKEEVEYELTKREEEARLREKREAAASEQKGAGGPKTREQEFAALLRSEQSANNKINSKIFRYFKKAALDCCELLGKIKVQRDLFSGVLEKANGGWVAKEEGKGDIEAKGRMSEELFIKSVENESDFVKGIVLLFKKSFDCVVSKEDLDREVDLMRGYLFGQYVFLRMKDGWVFCKEFEGKDGVGSLAMHILYFKKLEKLNPAEGETQSMREAGCARLLEILGVIAEEFDTNSFEQEEKKLEGFLEESYKTEEEVNGLFDELRPYKCQTRYKYSLPWLSLLEWRMLNKSLSLQLGGAGK